MNSCESAYSSVLKRIVAASAAAGLPRAARLVAVGKTKPAAALRALAALGQTAFGENYVQEALGKQAALSDLPIEWHAIGPLQSNKVATWRAISTGCKRSIAPSSSIFSRSTVPKRDRR